jgi:hypothetical protein
MASANLQGLGSASFYNKVNHMNEDFYIYSEDPACPFQHHCTKKAWGDYTSVLDPQAGDLVLESEHAFAYSTCYEKTKLQVALQLPLREVRRDRCSDRSAWLVFPLDLQSVKLDLRLSDASPREPCQAEDRTDPLRLQILCEGLRPAQGLQVRFALSWQGSFPVLSWEEVRLVWSESQLECMKALPPTSSILDRLEWALTGRQAPFDASVGPHREEVTVVLSFKKGRCFCTPVLTFSKDPSLAVALRCLAEVPAESKEFQERSLVSGDLYREWQQVEQQVDVPRAFVLRNLRPSAHSAPSDLELELVSSGEEPSSRTWRALRDVDASFWLQEWSTEHSKGDKKSQRYFRLYASRRAGAIEVCDDEDFVDVKQALTAQLQKMTNRSADEVKYEICKETLLKRSFQQLSSEAECQEKKGSFTKALQKISALCRTEDAEAPTAKRPRRASGGERPPSRDRPAPRGSGRRHWEPPRREAHTKSSSCRASSLGAVDHRLPERKAYLYGIKEERLRPLVTLRNLLESGGVIWDETPTSTQAFYSSVLQVGAEYVPLIDFDVSYLQRIKDTLKDWGFDSLAQWGISDGSLKGFSRADVQQVFRDFYPAPVWYGYAGAFLRPRLCDIDLAYSLYCYTDCLRHPDLASLRACVQAFPHGYSNQKPKDQKGFPIFLIYHSDLELCSPRDVVSSDELSAVLKKGMIRELGAWIDANSQANPFWEVAPLYRACLWLFKAPAAKVHAGSFANKLAALAEVSEWYKEAALKFASAIEDHESRGDYIRDLSRICLFQCPGVMPHFEADWLQLPASLQ